MTFDASDIGTPQDMSTIDRAAICKVLDAVLSPEDEIVVLHSSLYAFRFNEAQLKWPLLDALRSLVASGRTVAIPAFTFDFCSSGQFNTLTSQPETGVLASWALELEDFQRTEHPIYSFAVAGPRSEEIAACKSTTTFGEDSPFALFDRLRTRYVMFGCGWDVCTQFHFYEEEAGVPYRYYKTFEGTRADGTSLSAQMYVRDRWIDAANDFVPVVTAMREAGAIRSVGLGEGHVESISSQAFAHACREHLLRDPFAFVRDATHVRYRTTLKAQRNDSQPLKIAILGSSNVDTLCHAVKARLEAMLPARLTNVYAPPFGQAWREAMQHGSSLDRFSPDHAFFVDRLEDVQGADPGAVQALDEEAIGRYCDAIVAVAERPGCQVYVNAFVALKPGAGISGSMTEIARTAGAILSDRLAGRDNIHIVELGNLAASFAGGPICDQRTWFLGRLPFSAGFTQHLADNYSGLVASSLGATARLLVIDLDNTLWGGILGEDGVEGLSLGGDFPGNAFRHFQTMLKQLTNRGIALAVASKNDESEALAVINNHPEMPLRESDLATWRIGWDEKADSILSMADELGLGLANIAFIDDNPAERARMRAALPEVKVIDLPEDPTQYADAVLSSPWLACLSLTQEDRGRAASYQRARKVRDERQRFETDEAFFAHLAPCVHIAPLTPGNANRAAQLIAKTNQFNTTVRRLTLEELRALDRDGASVYVIGLEDRFSDLENIGVCVVHWNTPVKGEAEIDPFLLSCRVLGRGVETGFLAWLASQARVRRMDKLIGLIKEAPRNAPARGIYESHGFAAGETAARWDYDLAHNTLTAPGWVKIVDKTEAAHRV